MHNIRTLFNIEAQETGFVLCMGFLLFGNALAQQISGIVGISGFLLAEGGGPNQILLVWGVDALLIFLVTGLQSLLVDRFDRRTLMQAITLGFALIFVILRLFFTFQAPDWLNYSLLYLVSEQQWHFFPLIFWILANDAVDVRRARAIFPVIASLGFLGRLAGIGVAALLPSVFVRLQVDVAEVLNVNVLIYLVAYVLIIVGMRTVSLRQTRSKSATLREITREGMAFIRKVPSFYYLTLAIVAALVAETIIEFRFFVVAEAAFATPTQFQTFYSLYLLALTIAALLVQSLLSARIIEKMGLKSVFFLWPTTLVTSGLWMIALPGLGSGIGALFLQKLPQYTVDESARKAFQGLVPEERRGRVSVYMDSYLFSGGTLLACLAAGGAILLGAGFYGYMALAIVSALFALWALVRMRRVYDSSLWNWRLKRRQHRGSPLDKLIDP